MLRKLNLFLLTFLTGTMILAQDSTMSLVQILNELQSSNPAVLAYNDRIRAMEEYSKGAGALEAPQIGAGVFMTPYMFEKNMGSFMLSGQQMIMNPAKIRAERKVMDQMPALETAMQNEEVQMLFEEAKKMYYEWQTLEKKLAVLKQSKIVLESMISSAEISYKYNQVPLPRIYQAKAEYYRLNDMEIMIEKEIQSIRISLNTLMNRERYSSLKIDTFHVVPNLEAFTVDSLVLLTRSDFRRIEENILLLELQTRLQKVASLPDFGIRYDHMAGFGEQRNAFTVMGMVTIPFAPWASKGYKSKISAYSFEINALRKRQESIVNRELGRLAILRTEAEALADRLSNYRERILPALANNYETSLLAFEKRQDDLFMVLDALMAYNMARIEYLELINELMKLHVEYERVVEVKL